MSKYTPLTEFLAAQSAQEVPMTFQDIEKLIGCPLPASKARREWWSNNAANNVMTRAWLSAGYRSARVDVGEGRLTFRRDDAPPPELAVPNSERFLEGFFAHIRSRLGGTVRIAPGVDLTEPLWNLDDE